MNSVQNENKKSPRSRAPRLSPELDEFLHMMDALESQFTNQAAHNTPTRQGRPG